MVKRDFISYTNQPGDVTKNAFSRLIAATIKQAYEMAGNYVLRNFCIK